MKKLLSVLTALSLGITMLTGCGSTSSGGSNTATGEQTGGAEPTKVVFAMKSFNVIPDSANTERVQQYFNDYVAENYPDANVAIEWKLFGPADYDQKINLMMQSGEQLDLFIPANIATSLANNQLAPITDALANYGQGLEAIIKEYCGENAFEAVTQNGEIMAIPANKNMCLTPLLQYDTEMLAATGYTADDITDLESLTPIFAKLKELYPDVYPFVSTDLKNKNLPYYFYAEKEIDPLGNDYGVIMGDSGEIVNLFATEEYRDLCYLMKEWHDNGYMPADMATGTMTGTEYMMAGRGFCTYASYGSKNDYTEFATILTTRFGRDIGVKAIADSYLTTDFASATLGIPSTSKCVDAAIKLLDIIYTDEFAYNILLWGMEGTDYVKVTENTVNYPEGLTADTVPYCAYMTMGEFGTEAYCWNLEQGTSEEAKAANREYAKTVNLNANLSPYYGFRFDGSGVKNELTALNNVYEQYAYPLMCGSVDVDSTLEEFNKALEAAGLQTVMDAKREQLDAWLASK